MSTHVNECRHAYEHMSLVGLNAFCKCSFNDVTTHMHTHTLCTVQVMQEFVTQAHAHTHIDTLCTVQVMQEFDDALPTRRFDNFQFVNFTSEWAFHTLSSSYSELFIQWALHTVSSSYSELFILWALHVVSSSYTRSCQNSLLSTSRICHVSKFKGWIAPASIRALYCFRQMHAMPVVFALPMFFLIVHLVFVFCIV